MKIFSWLNQGGFPQKLNNIDIVLTPEKDNPISMLDLRPISLCNVLYKIISKVLANRLNLFLSKCISHELFAFVKGRSILDNVVVSIETVHHVKCKTQRKVGELALKVDISKAFDKVKWNFLVPMMLKIGFNPKWVAWIRMCVETVDYNILLNGDGVSIISLKRGLWQGDPISPISLFSA